MFSGKLSIVWYPDRPKLEIIFFLKPRKMKIFKNPKGVHHRFFRKNRIFEICCFKYQILCKLVRWLRIKRWFCAKPSISFFFRLTLFFLLWKKIIKNWCGWFETWKFKKFDYFYPKIYSTASHYTHFGLFSCNPSIRALPL